MIPRHLSPQERRRQRAARRPSKTIEIVQEHPAFHVTAAELAPLHPLLRSVIAALTRDVIRTTTVYDGDGRIVRVRAKRQSQGCSARTVASLLTSARALLDLEREIANRRATHDLVGSVDATPLHDRT